MQWRIYEYLPNQSEHLGTSLPFFISSLLLILTLFRLPTSRKLFLLVCMAFIMLRLHLIQSHGSEQESAQGSRQREWSVYILISCPRSRWNGVLQFALLPSCNITGMLTSLLAATKVDWMKIVTAFNAAAKVLGE